MEDIQKKHNEIVQLINAVNQLTIKFTEGEIVFFKENTISIRFHNAEICFVDLINWSYAFFIEVSTPSMKFISDKFNPYGVNVQSTVLEISKVVHAVRTIASHSMDYTQQSDIDKRNFCESWYVRVVGRYPPTREEEWKLCLNNLLDNTVLYLRAIERCLKIIVPDENASIVLYEWKRLVNRDYGVVDFERVLVQVLKDYGMGDLFDTNKIVKRYISVWKEDLKILKDGFNFSIEAAKIVSRFIEKRELCPVEASDLIGLGAPKSSELIKMNIEVRKIFYEDPCPKDILGL